jgi:dipeptidase D
MNEDLLNELPSSSAREAWRHFLALSSIPRPPGGEEKVAEYLKAVAASAGWETVQDRTGNLVMRIPGRGSLALEEILILQAHMDMVCEKDPGIEHDFSRDPLRLRIEGEWLQASGTTLGADNGIGMALALAAAEADLEERLPLELLFTVDEESGLTGAMRLDAGMLRGRRLINLDSEKEGVFIVSCAGGRSVTARFSRESTASPHSGPAVRFRLSGLRGGHSGVDISDMRANAVTAASGLLEKLRGRGGVQLLSLTGGTQFNVIPREAECVVSGVTPEEASALADGIVDELRTTEPGASLALERGEEASSYPLPWGVVDFIAALRKGVIAMDGGIEGLVETSSNLGVVKSDEGGVSLVIKIRSASDSRRDEECEKAVTLARLHGGDGEMGEGYPGWTSSSGSELVRGLSQTYRDLCGRSALITGIHAGLEAGVIGAMIGSGELVSLGPTIENAHSPGERLLIESVEPVYRLLTEFISSPP